MTHVISEQPRVVQRGGTPEASERSSSSVSTTAETIPTLQFSLYYDIQRRSLSVHLQQAYNLPAKDHRGTSDPFVVFFLLPNKEEIYESKVVYKTLNPIFDQVFEFGGILPQEIRRQTIMFRVYDHDRFTPNELIGVVALSLEEADLYGVSMKMRIDEKEEFRVRGVILEEWLPYALDLFPGFWGVGEGREEVRGGRKKCGGREEVRGGRSVGRGKKCGGREEV